MAGSATADGRVVFQVTADTSQLDNDLGKATTIIKNKSKEWGEAAKGEATLTDAAFSGLLETVSALGEAFGKMVVQFIQDGIELAETVADIDNAINATFGPEGAKNIDEWSRTLVSRLGFSELQAKKYAASIGLIGKQTGMTDDEMVQFTKDVVAFASDLSNSIPGMSSDTAFNEIIKALNGKSGTLSNHGEGFNLGAAAMKAYASEQGVNWNELNSKQQLDLRYQKLFETMESMNMLGGFMDAHGLQGNADARLQGYYDNAALAVGKPLESMIAGAKTGVADLLDIIMGVEQPINGTIEEWQAYKDAMEAALPALRELGDEAIAEVAEQYGIMRENFTPNGQYGSYGEWATAELYNRMRYGKFDSEQDLKDLQAIYPMLAELSSSITSVEGAVHEANEVISTLEQRDMSTKLQEQAAKDAQAYADGLRSKYAALYSAVEGANNIISNLGNTRLTNGNYGYIPQHAGGLDVVPRDNYLAFLHAGESVLTAEEAKVWRSMKYNLRPTSGVNYDALGSTMRDNVKAGGNVYLDGQAVGRVISARQADSYRAMERSGFQQ